MALRQEIQCANAATTSAILQTFGGKEADGSGFLKSWMRDNLALEDDGPGPAPDTDRLGEYETATVLEQKEDEVDSWQEMD